MTKIFKENSDSNIIAINTDGKLQIVLAHGLSQDEYNRFVKQEKDILGVSVQDIFIEEAKKVGIDENQLLSNDGYKLFFNDDKNKKRFDVIKSSIEILLEQESQKSPFEISAGAPGLGKNKS